MELISNCAHFGSTYTAFITTPEKIPVSVVKASFVRDGIELLDNEIRGLRWYAGRLGIDPGSVCSAHHFEERYAKITIPFHPGSCGDPYLPIKRNYTKIANAIRYYRYIFEKDEYRYTHGDFSLVNLIFEGDEIRWLIDWEHFNDRLPREFDVLDCIIEACYYNFMRKKELSREEVRLLKELLVLASNEIGFKANLETPAADYFAMNCTYSAVFGEQINKFPLIACPREDVDRIDSFFRKYR